MARVDSVAWCAACGAKTAHSRRTWNPRGLLPTLALALEAWLLVSAVDPLAWILGAGLAWIALVVWRVDRRRFWRIPCERCRGRAVHADEQTRWHPRFSTTHLA